MRAEVTQVRLCRSIGASAAIPRRASCGLSAVAIRAPADASGGGFDEAGGAAKARSSVQKEAVMPIDLSAEERTILRQVLDESLSELRLEIASTERLSYRDELRLRKVVIVKVIASLDGAP